MIRLYLSPETEELRSELRQWLQSNPPPRAQNDSSLDTFIRVGKEWQGALAQSRWVAVHWPTEYGGRGLTLSEEAVVQEELSRARAPQLLGLFGLTMVGPILIQYGTSAQKKRFLENILSAKEIWCQGFSEPGAGSDLSALSTRAIPVDDPVRGKGFLLSGQKVWTSFAQVADWCFVLCKSEEEAPKLKSFSYLLVDMKSPGINIRPLQQITGESEFNEVFFDEVFVPEENLVGSRGQGWDIAISTLMYERVVLTFSRQLQSETLLWSLIAEQEEGKLTPKETDELWEHITEYVALRSLAYSHLLDYSKGKKPSSEGSLDKLLWSESFQRLSKWAYERSPTPLASEEENPEVYRYLYSRGRTIAAGTSEIQRNIIAERLLQLPRLEYKERSR